MKIKIKEDALWSTLSSTREATGTTYVAHQYDLLVQNSKNKDVRVHYFSESFLFPNNSRTIIGTIIWLK
jgi:hypothetical protein